MFKYPLQSCKATLFLANLKDQQMQLTQLVYLSFYLDEYGTTLPDFIENSALADSMADVKGMTLFSHGNIIQLIEGERTAVGAVFRKLAYSPASKQFQVKLLIDCAVETSAISETSVGLAMNSLRLISRPPSKVTLFRLNPQEVSSRIADSEGKKLMLGFVEDYQSS